MMNRRRETARSRNAGPWSSPTTTVTTRAAAKDWAGADALAARSGPIAVDLVLWQRLRAGQGSWPEYRDFATRHADWPGMELFWRRGEAVLRPDLPAAEVLADPALGTLPGRFLFVLDDGSGDLIERSCDLGLVALDAESAQLRVGDRWSEVVPLAGAAARLVELARAFVQARGTGPDAPTGASARVRSGLGTQIVTTFVEDLHGEIAWHRLEGGGTDAHFSARLRPVPASN